METDRWIKTGRLADGSALLAEDLLHTESIQDSRVRDDVLSGEYGCDQARPWQRNSAACPRGESLGSFYVDIELLSDLLGGADCFRSLTVQDVFV